MLTTDGAAADAVGRAETFEGNSICSRNGTRELRHSTQINRNEHATEIATRAATFDTNLARVDCFLLFVFSLFRFRGMSQLACLFLQLCVECRSSRCHFCCTCSFRCMSELACSFLLICVECLSSRVPFLLQMMFPLNVSARPTVSAVAPSVVSM